MLQGLLKNAKITRILVDTAAGIAATASDILDMTGFDSVLFIAKLGTVTATSVTTLTCQTNSVNSATGMAALTSAVTNTDAGGASSNGLLTLDVVRPAQQFVRAVLTSATANAVKNGIIAIQYNAKDAPATQGATVLSSQTIQG